MVEEQLWGSNYLMLPHNNCNDFDNTDIQNNNAGRAAIYKFNSPTFMETDTTTNSLSRLELLTHCQMCLNPFQHPLTLSCGFTLCTSCLPESKQCPSFSCLRTHSTIDHRPTIVLEKIFSQFSPTSDFVVDESLKRLLDCSICLTTLSEPITTQCGHTFCKECLIKTMTDMPTRCCPYCRTELNRIGKENQLINEWLQFLDNTETYYQNEDQSAGSSDEEGTLQQPQHNIPLIQVTSAVAFPTQHCLFRTLDNQLILKRSRRRKHGKLYAICVYKKPSTNEFYEHGVMLQIDHVEHIPDIRHSVVQATGLFRLRINHLTVDSSNCYTGDVVRLDDLVENNEDFAISRQLIEQTKTKRWTMPSTAATYTQSTPATPTTSTSTAAAAISADQLHTPATSTRKITRPRPCSMRLSSSAPNNFHMPSNDMFPGSRRPWGTLMNNKPSSPPPSYSTTANSAAKKAQQNPLKFSNFQQQPSRSSDTITPTFTSLDELFFGELHPYIIHYLTSVGNEAWMMQYDRHLLNSNRNTITWWAANILPLEYNEKIILLSMETLRERMTALVAWADKGRSY